MGVKSGVSVNTLVVSSLVDTPVDLTVLAPANKEVTGGGWSLEVPPEFEGSSKSLFTFTFNGPLLDQLVVPQQATGWRLRGVVRPPRMAMANLPLPSPTVVPVTVSVYCIYQK